MALIVKSATYAKISVKKKRSQLASLITSLSLNNIISQESAITFLLLNNITAHSRVSTSTDQPLSLTLQREFLIITSPTMTSDSFHYIPFYQTDTIALISVRDLLDRINIPTATLYLTNILSSIVSFVQPKGSH